MLVNIRNENINKALDTLSFLRDLMVDVDENALKDLNKTELLKNIVFIQERILQKKESLDFNSSLEIDVICQKFNAINEISSYLIFKKDSIDITKINNLLQKIDKFLHQLLIAIQPYQQYDEFLSKQNQLNKNYNDISKKFDDLQSTANNRIQDMSNAINDGNIYLASQGLGKPFLDHAKHYEKIAAKWSLYISLLFLALVAVSLTSAKPENLLKSSSSIDLSSVLTQLLNSYVDHIPVLIMFFWLLWFCTKQYTHNAYLRDDYYYKAANSLSFYGYNEEAKKLDTAECLMQKKLLNTTIKNIGKNPADKSISDCNTPYSEIITKLNSTIAELSNLLKNLPDNIKELINIKKKV